MDGWGLDAREAKNRGWKGNFAFAGEIYLLDFFRLTPRSEGGGSFVRFAGTGSFNDLAESKLLLYAKDGDIDGLSQNERFFDFFLIH